MPRTMFLLMTHARQTGTALTACLQLTFLTERGSFKSGRGAPILTMGCYIALKLVV